MQSSVERRWIEELARSQDPLTILRSFLPQYYYFSLHQVIAFSGMITRVPVRDRGALAVLGDVLHEELGRGEVSRVHSVLLERLMEEVGLDVDAQPPRARNILPGVRRYVDELYRAFREGSHAEALAAYRFLERSAIETYEPLYDALRGHGFKEHALEFFGVHASIEHEHAAAANLLVEQSGFAEGDLAEQEARLAAMWQVFWRDIANHCRQAND